MKPVAPTPLIPDSYSWEQIFDSVSDAIWLLDSECRILKTNRAGRKLFGKTDAELVGRHCWEIVHGTDCPIPNCPMQRMRETRRREETELIMGDRTYRVTVDPICDAAGQLTGCVHIIRDITQRKHMEAALAVNERRFQTLVENCPIGITILDRTGQVIYDAGTVAPLTGYTPQELVGKSVFDLVTQEDRAVAEGQFRSLIQHPGATVTLDLAVRAKDGTTRILRVSATNKLTDPAIGGVVINSFDITDRRRSEEELRLHDALLVAAFDNAPFQFWVRDKNGVCIMENAAIKAHWGSILGTRPEDTNIAPETLERWLRNNQRALEGETVHNETTYTHNGVTKIYDETIAPFRINGVVQGFLGFNIDITERTLAHRALQESEARWDLALAALPVGTYSFRPTTGDLTWDAGFRRNYGYTATETATFEKWTERIHPLDRNRVVASAQAALAGGDSTIWTEEFRILHPSLGVRWLVDWAHVERDATGHALAITGFNIDITDRKRSELALQKSETRLRLALEAMPAGTYSFEPASGILSCDAGYRRLYGYTTDEPVGFPQWIQRMHSADRERMLASASAAMAPGDTPSWTEEFRILHPSLGERWLVDWGRVERDAKGQAISVTGFVLDITERKRTENLLRESELRFRQLVETASEGIWETDTEFRTTFVNRRLAAMLGYRPDELLGRHVTEFARPESVTSLQQRLTRRRDGVSEAYEFEIYRRDGETFWGLISGAPRFDPNGNFIGAVALITDISALKQAEAEQRHLAKQFRQLIESIPMLAWQSNEKGEARYCNQRWYEYTGAQQKETLGKLWQIALHPDDEQRVRDETNRAAAAGDPYHVEYRLRRHDGEYRWHLARAVPVRDATGKISMWVGCAADIEDQKRSEAVQRHMAERFRMILESIPTIAVVADANGSLTFANQHWYAYSGTPIDTSLERLLRQVVHPDDFERMYRHVQHCLKNGEAYIFETRLRRHDGQFRWHWTHSEPVRDETGQIIMWVVIAVDIEDSKQAQETLRTQEQYYRQMVQAMPQLAWRCDAKGMAIDCNDRWTEYTGQRPDEALGAAWMRSVHPDDQPATLQEINRAIAAGDCYRTEYRLRRAADGVYRWHLAIGLPVRNTDGQVACWIGTSTDIHDQKELAAELERRVAERTAGLKQEIKLRTRLEQQLLEITEREQRRIGQDLHDGLGQKLTGLKYLTDSLSRTLDGAGRPEAKTAQRLSALLGEATESARSLSHILHPIAADDEALLPSLRELAHHITLDRGIRCRLDCAGPVRIRDHNAATQLYRIAQEAVHNASRHSHAKSIVIALSTRNGWLSLDIVDDGSGLPPKSRRGNGIGLDIMKYRAETIGASFAIRRRRPRGTRVTCKWKLSKAERNTHG